MIVRIYLLCLGILLVLAFGACSPASNSATNSFVSGLESEPSSAAIHSLALAESRIDDAPSSNNYRARMSEVSLSGTAADTLPVGIERAQNQDNTEELTLSNLGSRWLYGQGLGTSMVNISTSILFPPYAVYLLGNAGLEIAGLQTFYATDALPEKPRAFVLEFYDGLTSVPGRLAALIAGRSYHEKKALSPAAAMQIVQNYAQEQ